MSKKSLKKIGKFVQTCKGCEVSLAKSDFNHGIAICPSCGLTQVAEDASVKDKFNIAEDKKMNKLLKDEGIKLPEGSLE